MTAAVPSTVQVRVLPPAVAVSVCVPVRLSARQVDEVAVAGSATRCRRASR